MNNSVVRDECIKHTLSNLHNTQYTITIILLLINLNANGLSPGGSGYNAMYTDMK